MEQQWLLLLQSHEFCSWWFSDKIVLAMYRAKEVSKGDAPVLYNVVERLAERTRMPMPKAYNQ